MCLEAGDAGAGPRSSLGGLLHTSRPGGRGDHDVEHVESSSSSTTVISSPALLKSRAAGVGSGVNTTTSSSTFPSRRPDDRCRSSCFSSSSATSSSSRRNTTTTMSMKRRITTTKEPRTATEAEQLLPVSRSTPTSSTIHCAGGVESVEERKKGGYSFEMDSLSNSIVPN
ncbi:unnamed protein product [Amoebophrya sp. A120]|nr:unnamed protein product [Amoebophrya sp. A120]|eukprot:GSA120T00013524001.1